MMHIRRVLVVATAVAALAAAAPDALAQKVDKQTRKEQERRSKQEQSDIQALVQMVDAVNAGTLPAPADIAVAWESNHFVKSSDASTYIPFTVMIDPSKLASPGVALYVRAVEKAPAAAASAPPNDRAKNQAPVYAWDNVHFLDVPADGKVSRALAVKAGEYDLFIAVKEKTPAQQPKNAPPAKAGMIKRDLSVPDFTAPSLKTSTVIIAKLIEPVTTALTPEQQQENPYTFGSMKVTPSIDMKLKKSGELQVLFWIYGMQQTSGKPDVQVEYSFHQKMAEGEKFFNKTAPQLLNASTLPPQFDAAAGHQLPGSLVVPLASFPVGEYRLEIKITDKVSGQTLTQNSTFTVES